MPPYLILHITSALTTVKDHVIKYSETDFSNSNVKYFWSIKTLPRLSKSCDYVTFRILKYFLSTFPLYTPHCHMILSIKAKLVSLDNCVSTGSKRTSVLQAKRAFLATRSMTRMNVGLALSYVKLLLYRIIYSMGEREEIWLSLMTKIPFINTIVLKKEKWQLHTLPKGLDNTPPFDQLGKVSLSNKSHPTGVFKPFYGIPILST